jgi:urease accessory protein
MRHDTARMRADRPWVMTNLKTGEGLDEVIKFIEKAGCLKTS